MASRYRFSTANEKGSIGITYKPLKSLVRPARFELTAFGSGGQRSIQLSYERIRTFLICFVLAAVKVSRQCQLPRAVTMAIGQQASGGQTISARRARPLCGISAVIPVCRE